MFTSVPRVPLIPKVVIAGNNPGYQFESSAALVFGTQELSAVFFRLYFRILEHRAFQQPSICGFVLSACWAIIVTAAYFVAPLVARVS